jgi:hypothetical protein
MDRVKFGRALGYGARHAARTLAQAVDAAASPNPSSRAAHPPSPTSAAGHTAAPGPSHRGAATARIPDGPSVRAAGRQATRSFAAPLLRFSSVLWLQLTGVFFSLIACTMGAAAWRVRSGLHAASSSPTAVKFYAYLAVCVVFTYFTVSSFHRAKRR